MRPRAPPHARAHPPCAPCHTARIPDLSWGGFGRHSSPPQEWMTSTRRRTLRSLSPTASGEPQRSVCLARWGWPEAVREALAEVAPCWVCGLWPVGVFSAAVYDVRGCCFSGAVCGSVHEVTGWFFVNCCSVLNGGGDETTRPFPS